MKKDIIRCGDKVKIENPLFFIRCGYPKTVESECEAVEKEHGEQITDLLFANGLKQYLHSSLSHINDNWVVDRVRRKIVREIAWARLRTHGFGGYERQLYTEEKPDLKGRMFYVADTKIHKTGIYASGGYSGVDYWEYEPASLEHQQTHKIIYLRPHGGLQFVSDKPEHAIEVIHVSKVREDNEHS